MAFQPTLPARGATTFALQNRALFVHFNPRSPHGERPEPPAAARAASNFNPRSPHGERPDGDAQAPPRKISTHAPRTGSDPGTPGGTEEQKYFNPRSPHGERRRRVQRLPFRQNFNPRSPHGERQAKRGESRGRHAFQPTLPARGATVS